MKNVRLILLFLFLSVNYILKGQIYLDLGPDTTYCGGADIYPGGNMKLENAVEPLTYCWECADTLNGTVYTTDWFLDDSTKQFPFFLGHVNKEWLHCKLEITDSEGNRATDSINIRVSYFVFQDYMLIREIMKGDSLELSAGGIDQGFPPYEYFWTPKTFLSDTTGPTVLAIPDSTITYFYRVRDSMGCYSGWKKQYLIIVNSPDLVEPKHPVELPFSIKGSSIVFVEWQTTKEIVLFDLTGRVFKRIDVREVAIDMRDHAEGMNSIFGVVWIDEDAYPFKMILE